MVYGKFHSPPNSVPIVGGIKTSDEQLLYGLYNVVFTYVLSRHGLHFISDEAYAMSIYEFQTAFQSVLSLPSVPDPQKTHVIWSFSKVTHLLVHFPEYVSTLDI
jgi:hypothetical protein